MITLFQLVDPMSGLRFPTPIPRSTMPAVPDLAAKAAWDAWKSVLVAKVRAQAPRPPAQVPQPMMTSAMNEEALNRAQEHTMHLARLERRRYENAMYAIRNTGYSNDRRWY
jgi:hypothetical protein